jgi:hypothetical protein
MTACRAPPAEQTFVNGDVLDDPQLYDGTYPLVIVEGEPDLLSAIDCGFVHSVSVPAGVSDRTAHPSGDASSQIAT